MKFGDHPQHIKVMIREDPSLFDSDMLKEARRIIDWELQNMLIEGVVFQKQILARRLGIHRNRISHLLKMVGLKELT